MRSLTFLLIVIEPEMNHFSESTPLAPISKNDRNLKINKWLLILGHKATVKTIVNNPTESIKTLYDSDMIKHSDANHRNFIGAIMAYVRYEVKRNRTKLMSIWEEIFRKANEPLDARAYTGEPTALQADKVVSWDTIEKVRDSLPLSSTKVLLGMYSLIPPQRGGDYYDLKIYTTDPKTTTGNYLIMEKGKEVLVMNDYKTDARYGQNRVPLPATLVSLINAYWEKNSNPENVLFIMPDKGTPYDRKQFSGWAIRVLKKAFGKATTLTVLRHAYISSLNHNRPIKEMKQTATIMGQSVGHQQSYRWTPTE